MIIDGLCYYFTEEPEEGPFIDSYGTPLTLTDPDNQCLTTDDSPSKNIPCVLPFKFQGKLRNECITETDPNDRYWCSTKVNENLEHADGIGNWGYCSESCPRLNKESASYSNTTTSCEIDIFNLRKIASVQGHPWQCLKVNQ